MPRALNGSMLAAVLAAALLPPVAQATEAEQPAPTTASGDVSAPAAGATAQVTGQHEQTLAVEGNVLEASAEEFMLAGLTWDASGPQVTNVQMRLREGENYGPWETVELNEAGTAVDGRLGTAPFLSNGADGVQVRITTADGAPAKDAEVSLIDPGTGTLDGRAPAEVAPQTTLKSAPQTASPDAAGSTLGTASAQTTLTDAEVESLRPAIVRRAAWGADESRYGTFGTVIQPKAMILHHTASTNNYTREQAAAQVRAIYLYQASTLGWGDIGYHFLVDKFGTVYEGRKDSPDFIRTGAHAAGMNTETFGISALGNYHEVMPTAALQESITRVAAWQLAKNGIDPYGTAVLTSTSDSSTSSSRFRHGQQVTLPTVMGHISTSRTVCPGQYLEPRLTAIQKAAADRIAAAVTPAPAPAPAPQPSPAPAGQTQTTMTVNLRTTASWTSSTNGTVAKGATVTLLGTNSSGWELVRTADGRQGWIHGSYLTAGTPAPAPAPQNLATTTMPVNLRLSASWSAATNGTVPKGATVTLLGTRQAGWELVRTSDGRQGWILDDYLRVGTSTTPVPAPAPAPSSQVQANMTVNLRATASWTAATNGIVRAGETVTLLGKRTSGWEKVRTSDGREGWIMTTYLGTSSSPTMTTTMAVNLRDRASWSAGILSMVRAGETVTLLGGEAAGWKQVRTSDGRQGWIQESYLR